MSGYDSFDTGYDAYWEGIHVSTNPHQEDTEEYYSWEAGWLSARQHDYDESEGRA